jgi:pimeloyl-ACP methyl ester carboxylesterase
LSFCSKTLFRDIDFQFVRRERQFNDPSVAWKGEKVMTSLLSYDDQGSGPPVVLLHGFPFNRNMWSPQIDFLARSGFRIICPDLPGFGDSPLDQGAITMSGYADAVVNLLDTLKISQAVIGGMSMGGYVLLNLVERYPERVRAAMYLVTRAAGDDPAAREKRTFLAQEVTEGRFSAVPEAFIQVLFAPETPSRSPELIEQVQQWMNDCSAAGVVAGLLAMRDRKDYVASLGQLDVPSLVVGAEHDMAVPPEHAQVLAAGLPQAELALVPEAGHMANLERPALFNDLLLNFLRKVV